MPTGLEFGTLQSLQSLHKKFPEQEIVLCLDSKESQKRRQCSEYKANRPQTDRYNLAREDGFIRFLQCHYVTSRRYEYEADDVMYSLSKTYPGPHLLYTNDSDLLQAVDDERDVKVLKSFQSKLYEWDEAKVVEKWGVRPELLPLLRSFVGDSSDNLHGVPRINKKYLAKLLCWADEQQFELMRVVDEVATGDWPSKMQAAIIEYVDSGLWRRNYDLMQLKVVLCDVTYPVLDEKFTLTKLLEWEIRTLDLCEPYRSQLVPKDSEF